MPIGLVTLGGTARGVHVTTPLIQTLLCSAMGLMLHHTHADLSCATTHQIRTSMCGTTRLPLRHLRADQQRGMTHRTQTLMCVVIAQNSIHPVVKVDVIMLLIRSLEGALVVRKCQLAAPTLAMTCQTQILTCNVTTLNGNNQSPVPDGIMLRTRWWVVDQLWAQPGRGMTHLTRTCTCTGDVARVARKLVSRASRL